MLEICVGDTVVLPAREVTEEMLNRRAVWRESLGLLSEKSEPSVGHAKILRVYIRPRDQEILTAEIAKDRYSITITGLNIGTALVDVIDEASEPEGTMGFAGGHEVVVRRRNIPSR